MIERPMFTQLSNGGRVGFRQVTWLPSEVTWNEDSKRLSDLKAMFPVTWYQDNKWLIGPQHAFCWSKLLDSFCCWPSQKNWIWGRGLSELYRLRLTLSILPLYSVSGCRSDILAGLNPATNELRAFLVSFRLCTDWTCRCPSWLFHDYFALLRDITTVIVGQFKWTWVLMDHTTIEKQSETKQIDGLAQEYNTSVSNGHAAVLYDAIGIACANFIYFIISKITNENMIEINSLCYSEIIIWHRFCLR